MRIRDWLSGRSAPTATLTADERPTQDRQPTIEITGEWMNQLWQEQPAKLLRDVDAAMAFLSQPALPHLWSDDPTYMASIDNKPDPQRENRVAWTVAYLNHPAAEVVERTLRDHVTPDLLRNWLISGSLPGLMVHPAPAVREEAARRIWDCAESDLRSVLGVFSGRYTGTPSALQRMGSVGGEFTRQRADVVKALRAHCPPEKRAFFEEQVAEVFGPSLAESEQAAPPGEVTFVRKEVKQMPLGVTATYEVHSAQSKRDALAFLENHLVEQDYYYLVVETPEGTWGKDKAGLFEE
jgi:hypothetical protein